jgi:hypothetical protein
VTTTPAQRRELGRLMDLLVEYEPKVHYAQVRPMRTRSIANAHELLQALRSPRGITMDCSESVTLLCRLAGLHDPSGLGFNGQGYTGTLLEHLQHYTDPSIAAVGGLVVFGPGNGQHVAMVRRAGHDPLLFSHGQERGPLLVRYSVERHAHTAPARFLSIEKLGA